MHRRLRAALAMLVSLGVVLAIPSSASAAPPYKDISSAGPLAHVYVGNELGCQVAHVTDGGILEFYQQYSIPGDCGTFVVTGNVLYAPNFATYSATATGGLGIRTPFTPVSQSAVTGSGTATDPYRVVTVVSVGETGLTIAQTDSYVAGDEAYRTDVAISNTGAASVSGILYRAGDCYLGGNDQGYGFTETFGTRKAVGCSKTANNTPQGRIEEWIPLTGGNRFYEDFFANVWRWIGGKTAFPDTCDCGLFEDNGAGIGWDFDIAAGSTITYSHMTTFSPLGKQALVTTKVADAPSSTAGSQNGYTITISNPNPVPVTLNSITDTLPGGFGYVAGSSSGVTTTDPGINGQALTWSGPFVVGASGSVALHFSVAVASTPGIYSNEASGEAADGYTVLPSGPSAPIEVMAATDDDPPIVSVTGVTDGATYIMGSVPTPGCDTEDPDSGVANEAALTVSAGTNGNGVGTFIASCGGAVDQAGNHQSPDPVTATFTVVYDGLSGILQPINPDNTSIFKRGQAVPVKFRLAGDEQSVPPGFDTSAWTIARQSMPCSAFDAADAALENVGSNTPYAQFRYDATADQYVFNADMRSAPVGSCWRFQVTLDSGQVLHSAIFRMAK